LPSVGTTVTYSRSAPTTNLFFREPSLQNTIGANVLLRWNLFAGFQTMAAVRDAELVQEKAQANLTQYEKDLAGEVFKAHVVLQAQIEAARVADGNRQQAREGLRIATDLYTAGAVSTLELRDAQVKLTNAELSWIQSRIDVELARLVLERSMGTLSKPVM
jgi:outer membrane protein